MTRRIRIALLAALSAASVGTAAYARIQAHNTVAAIASRSNVFIAGNTYLPETPPKWPCGIFKSPPPFPSTVRIMNDWSCDVYGEHVQVFAGSMRKNPSQGMLFIIARSLDLHHTGGDKFYGPAGEGPLSVVSYKGTVLKIRTGTGNYFYFSIHPGGYTLH